MFVFKLHLKAPSIFPNEALPYARTYFLGYCVVTLLRLNWDVVMTNHTETASSQILSIYFVGMLKCQTWVWSDCLVYKVTTASFLHDA